MNVAIIGILALITLAVGVLLALTPYLMPYNECFAVTVPAFAQRDSRLISLKRQYTVKMLILTAVVIVISLTAGMLMIAGQEEVGVWFTSAALIGLAVASFVLMLYSRHKVIKLKHSEGWEAIHHQVVASIAEEELPGAISLTWNLIYIPIILGTVCLGFVLYPNMPDLLPMHANALGTVDYYAPKTLGSSIGLPVAFEVLMAICFVSSHWIILHSKHPSNPGAPATSALAYGLFARAQSVLLLVMGVLLTSGSGLLFLLSFAGFIGLGQAGFGIIVLCIPFVIGSVVLLVIYGQAGSHVFMRMREDSKFLADDDEHWKFGTFYLNREDVSIFLPKRFGFGWTINFARPEAWAFIVGFITLIVAFIVLIPHLMG